MNSGLRHAVRSEKLCWKFEGSTAISAIIFVTTAAHNKQNIIGDRAVSRVKCNTVIETSDFFGKLLGLQSEKCRPRNRPPCARSFAASPCLVAFSHAKAMVS